MFPRAVSLSLPKILASLARRQSLSRHCIVPQGLAAKEGSYLDAQVSVGFFEQRLPSDRLNYIMVVVKLFMKVSKFILMDERVLSRRYPKETVS